MFWQFFQSNELMVSKLICNPTIHFPSISLIKGTFENLISIVFVFEAPCQKLIQIEHDQKLVIQFKSLIFMMI